MEQSIVAAFSLGLIVNILNGLLDALEDVASGRFPRYLLFLPQLLTFPLLFLQFRRSKKKVKKQECYLEDDEESFASEIKVFDPTKAGILTKSRKSGTTVACKN